MHPTGRWVSPGFLRHYLVGMQAPHCSLQRREIKSLWHGGGRATVFSVMFGWSRATVLCKLSIVGGCPFLGVLAKEQAFIGALFFFPASLGISGLPVTGAPSLPYIRQKESSGNSLLWIFFFFLNFRSHPVCLLSTWESSYICCICDIQRF